jgi:hypothetical protein
MLRKIEGEAAALEGALMIGRKQRSNPLSREEFSGSGRGAFGCVEY